MFNALLQDRVENGLRGAGMRFRTTYVVFLPEGLDY